MLTFVVPFSHQMTPLHVAAERGGRLRIVEYLVKNGANINIQDSDKVCDYTFIMYVTILVTADLYC